MKKNLLLLITIILIACNSNKNKKNTDAESMATWISEIQYPEEKYLRNIKQLTFGGDNAEAYFSFDDSKLVFQSNYTEWGVEWDQIFITDTNNYNMWNEMPSKISTGL